ncbi:hypothetical protein A4X06_0g8392 [Tilletia controversa]|uniref:Uncharacterized protein n=1 Tax=Tilletia controversa TaxID=13291 RepID=A0A8X7STB1_9BASI|nr:hypothetical protein CF335_g4839 [Tilletia laevis]KAE8239276.1 hypothetical protein A4X06_0g8392 [Tilletia controversa]
MAPLLLATRIGIRSPISSPPLKSLIRSSPHHAQFLMMSQKVQQQPASARFIAVVTVAFDPAGPEDEGHIPAIQELRHACDRAADRWAPHITIVPPFDVKVQASIAEDADDPRVPTQPSRELGMGNDAAEPSTATPFTSLDLRPAGPPSEQYSLPDHIRAGYPQGLRDALQRLEEHIEQAVSTVQPGKVVLDQVGRFQLRAYDTIHLRPSKPTAKGKETSEAVPTPLHNLWSAVGTAVDASGVQDTQQSDKSKRHKRRNDFSPHLTLGQGVTADEKENVTSRARAIIETEPLSCKVERFQLLFKNKSKAGPYLVWREFALLDK